MLVGDGKLGGRGLAGATDEDPGDASARDRSGPTGRNVRRHNGDGSDAELRSPGQRLRVWGQTHIFLLLGGCRAFRSEGDGPVPSGPLSPYLDVVSGGERSGVKETDARATLRVLGLRQRPPHAQSPWAPDDTPGWETRGPLCTHDGTGSGTCRLAK